MSLVKACEVAMPIMSNVLTSIEGSDLGAGMTNITVARRVKKEFWKTYHKKTRGVWDREARTC